MAGTIFYVGQFKFPQVAANSLRVLGNALALQEAGYKVCVIPGGNQAIGCKTAAKQLAQYEGIPFLNIQGSNRRPRKLVRFMNYVFAGWRLTNVLKLNITDETVAVIATAGGASRYFPFLGRLCRAKKLPFICDLMEWYDGTHLPLGKYGPFSWENEACMKWYFPRLHSIIVISSYLARYYAERGCRVIRIPPLLNSTADKWSPRNGRTESNRTLLCFIGSAGKKDLLVNAIRGLAVLGSQARECELWIAGPSMKEVSTSLGEDCGLLDLFAESLHIVGHLPHQEALHQLAKADFSILLRPDLRFAHAGFPTKLVESMAMGVPVICNLTGDIGAYVRDGEEGVIVRDCSPGAFAEGLRRALSLSKEQRRAMRAKARQRAMASFDYRNWVEPMSGFLRQVIENRR